jgi:hypothetical protein
MDINGAKALKQRLGRNGADEAPPAAELAADVPADAPPVYRWTGVDKPRSEASTAPSVEDEPEAPAVSFLRRLVPSFR